jgi:hypothetical protein
MKSFKKWSKRDQDTDYNRGFNDGVEFEIERQRLLKKQRNARDNKKRIPAPL